ncbi:MAG: exonuclease SbcCD subunit D [Oscillospiraceae bacterium]|nr:exonuclease SbcCD subunit D [Oscillospiraceae bacterium]
MKFLHLSDLHIGKSVNGFSMITEQKHAFGQITEYIKTERPDAVIIAGDVYDRAVPGVEAVRVFDDFLTELAGSEVAVLLISGNHDSPERLGYASRLLMDKRIYFYGAFDGSIHKVTLPDEYGEVNFWLMPFIKPAMVRGMFEDKDTESYDELIMAALNSAEIDYTARNVLISHQFYTKAGITPMRSESELNPVGGLDAVDAELISKFDYAALGHLHGGQSAGSKHIRYCGSPVKYSFSEWRQEKSVTLVELRKKGDLSVKAFPLTPIYDMREIKGDIDTLTSIEISSLANKEDYLRVILTNEEEIIDPLGKLRSVYPNIMSLDFENTRTSIDITAVAAGAEAIEKLSPYELFSEFFLEMQGAAMSDEQAEIVRSLLERTNEE